MPLEVLWLTAQALRWHLSDRSGPAAGRAAAAAGLKGPGWTLLLRAHLAAQQPLSAARLGALNPCINPWTYEAGRQHLAAVGQLAKEAGAYPLTQAGRAALQPRPDGVYAALCALPPLDPAALVRLAGLLQQVVAGSLAAPDPPGKALLRLSHRLAADTRAHPMAAIDQALADLAAYREDAHLAAWQTQAVSGPAWDVLGSLWRGPAAAMAEVFAKLARCGWPSDAYARALQELVTRGWVAGPEHLHSRPRAAPSARPPKPCPTGTFSRRGGRWRPRPWVSSVPC